MTSRQKSALLFLFAIVIAVFAYYRITQSEELNSRPLYLSIFWLIGTTLLITLLNMWIGSLLDRKLDWKSYAGIRFALQMILGTLLSLTCLNLSYFILKDQFTTAAPDIDQIVLMNIYGIALILPIFAIRFGYKFLKAWRKSAIEYERLQKENARSQMMSLRNHLDPHFLFNNLNILSSLIDKDKEMSKSYLDKFAEVYRIILRTEYADLSTVREEIKLIDSYIYLLQIRFENAVNFDINIAQACLDKAIPPLTLQMLIENAIKHNSLSDEKPITIKIYDEDCAFLHVENNLQKKKYLPSSREGTGIDNIKKRYEFFTDEKITIEETDTIFRLKLPMLEIEDI